MREPEALQPIGVTEVRWRGRNWTYFAGCDYLRLSWHPKVRAAIERAVTEWGPTVGASRMTTGNVRVFGDLEADLARFLGMGSATLTASGYTAPWMAVQALAPDHERVLVDERAHACLLDAAQWTGLKVERFPHRDPEGLARVLGRVGRGGQRRRVLVLTDGLFAHDGSVAPVERYLELLPRSRGTLVVDDAHGVGVVGERGRGTLELRGADRAGVVLTMTLSKGLGCYGGTVLGPPGLRRRIRERSRLFTGNTPLPPPYAAGARAALEVLHGEGVERRARLATHVSAVRQVWSPDAVGREDLPGPVVAVAPGRAGEEAVLGRLLRAARIYPPLIRYPNGPSASYFRFAISSEHTVEEVARLQEVLHSFRRRCR